jgi:hypothetical protein
MADRSLVERKLEVSQQLVSQLMAEQAPLLAAYWELSPEREGWVLYLVPKAIELERQLIDVVSEIMIAPPYRSAFSLSDVFVDAHQIARARAIGSYLRSPDDLGRQFDTTFTGGHYFESIIVLYIAPELQRAHHAA